MIVLCLFSGVLLDRICKRRLLIITQASLMVLFLLLAVLIWIGYVEYWHIMIFAFIQGCINSFDNPAKQAFVVELVGKDKLMSAMALNSSAASATRIIGPAIAGMIMAYFDAAFCFFSTALGFAFVIYGLIKIGGDADVKKADTVTGSRSFRFKDIAEGFAYVFENKVLFKYLVGVFIVSMFAMNFGISVPVLARNVLGQNEAGFGLLMSSLGMGSFAGAIILAAKSRSVPKKVIFSALPYVISLLLILLGLSGTYSMTTVLLGLSGFSQTMFITASNSTLLTDCRDEFRGRVVSIYTLVFLGGTPMGNMLTGGLADRFGVQTCFVICGVAILLSILPLHFFWMCCRKVIK